MTPCGPRQYPPGACNLDEIGRGDAWRACMDILTAIYSGLAYAMADDRVRSRPGLTLEHGVYEAPITALWRLFAGLDVFPVELAEVAA